MVPETLVLLLAISVTANLFGLTNSGTVKEEYISIATTPPNSQQTPLDQLENGTASRDVKKITWATNDTSVKDSKPVKSVETFDKQVDRVGNFPSRNHTTFGIFVRKPASSGLGFVNRRWSVLGKDMARTRRLAKRSASKRNGGNVELGKKSKMKREVGANVKKVRKKRVKRTKKSGQTRNYKQHKGLNAKSSKNKARGAMQETIHESKRYAREARRPRYIGPLRPIDYYGGLYDDYYVHYDDHKKKAEGGLGEGRERRKGNIKKHKKVKRPSAKFERDDQELNDFDDKEYFDGGHAPPKQYSDEDLDYAYLQRKRRESGDDEERSKAYTFNESLGLLPALNHARDSWTTFELKPGDKAVQSKRKGARSINRTPPHQLVLSVNSNKIDASVAEGKQGKPEATRGKRTTPSVIVKRPTPPVFLSLCSDKVCANGGTCLRSAIRGIICICPTGYSGKTCDNRLDPCNRHQCQNGATCIFAAKTQSMRCQCPAGFSGQLCQIDINECSSDPCLNGARCLDHVDGFSCMCLSGFEGQRCETNTDDCLGRICANGGRCIDGLNRYRCQCRPGFFGRHCQRVSDACLRSPCFNGGECIAMDSRGHFYKCLCRTGYVGARCEIQAARCIHTWCQNGGTCMEAAGSFQCLCPPGLTGNLCEVNEVSLIGGVPHKCQPDVCQRRGTCVDTPAGYRCECPSEAVGDRCQFDRDACHPNPCVNDGLCIPTGGPFYFCLCDQRFAGKICQFETRPCAAGNKTCENGGTCLDYHLQRRPNRYQGRPCDGEKCLSLRQNAMKELTVIRCVCPLLFTGPRCTVRNLPCTIGVCKAGQECKEDPHNPVEGYSCIDKKQSEVALENATNRSKTVQKVSPSHERREKVVSKTAAIVFGAAMIVTIFGIAFLVNGYSYFRSKEDNVYEPVRNDQQHIISDIRTQMENPRT